MYVRAAEATKVPLVRLKVRLVLPHARPALDLAKVRAEARAGERRQVRHPLPRRVLAHGERDQAADVGRRAAELASEAVRSPPRPHDGQGVARAIRRRAAAREAAHIAAELAVAAHAPQPARAEGGALDARAEPFGGPRGRRHVTSCVSLRRLHDPRRLSPLRFARHADACDRHTRDTELTTVDRVDEAQFAQYTTQVATQRHTPTHCH